MRHPHADSSSITLPTTNAFAICDGLLKMAHCLINELPEAELTHIRDTVDALLIKTDQRLGVIEQDFSLNFDGLSINPSECQMYYSGSSNLFLDARHPSESNDFNTVLVSTSTYAAVDSDEPQPDATIHRR